MLPETKAVAARSAPRERLLKHPLPITGNISEFAGFLFWELSAVVKTRMSPLVKTIPDSGFKLIPDSLLQVGIPWAG